MSVDTAKTHSSAGNLNSWTGGVFKSRLDTVGVQGC